MIESTTDSNEFRSKDGTVVRISDADFNITPGSVTKYTTPCSTRIRTATVCVKAHCAISVYVTLEAGVHVQMFQSSGQSEAKAGIKWPFLFRTIKTFSETYSIADHNRSARPLSLRTPVLIKEVRKRIRQTPS
ncbi:hypothetical protein TNCV_4876421 [Trichonephila clavipes]|uniref:Uncharacterized protein n=1 Tax=Trichonephila clavipes TaxID=2585209 RepID=A0A8X6REW4_TRICX|nr:hypothetical protein TNCV_4876421 [Trichonephila clavipes]